MSLSFESFEESYIKRQSYEYSEEDRSAVANTVLKSIKKIAGRKGLLSGE
jgi:hypothetical protein